MNYFVNYLLIISILINVFLACKILAMKLSLRELRTGFYQRGSFMLDTNTTLRVQSRDRDILSLAITMNEQLSNLRGAYHKYVRGDKEVKTAITNIAHDLRTPLTAILGYLELCDDLTLCEEAEKNLSIIKDRAIHMKKLTEELFEFSVLSTEEIREEKVPVNIGHVLEDCIMNFYPDFTRRGIEPVLHITENPVQRSLYPSYVERIITNLLNNAVKYSDGDLEVTLTDGALLRITNSAQNLSTVDVNKLFDRFFTVENGRNNSTGLGLSIVKLFAERMNCPLDADYDNGKLSITIQF